MADVKGSKGPNKVGDLGVSCWEGTYCKKSWVKSVGKAPSIFLAVALGVKRSFKKGYIAGSLGKRNNKEVN